MVQLNPLHCPNADVGTRRAARRSLLIARYHTIRAFGTCHPSRSERETAIAETLARGRARFLSRVHNPDTLAPAMAGGNRVDNDVADTPPDVAVAMSSRFAVKDETAPCPRRGMAGSAEALLLSPAERARVRLEVAMARDAEEWELGRAEPCRWLVAAQS